MKSKLKYLIFLILPIFIFFSSKAFAPPLGGGPVGPGPGGGGGGGAPTTAQYYVAVNDPTLTNDIVPAADVRAILAAANNAAVRALLGLTIGTNVQAYDADLDTYAAITPSWNVQNILSAANYAAIRQLLDLEAGIDFYSMAAANTAFLGTDERFTAGAGVAETVNADATPDVSACVAGTTLIFESNANGTITDFVDSDGDHSEFSDGDWFIFYLTDAATSIDFSANANIEGNAGVDFTGSATQIAYLIFVFESSRWNCLNLFGMSSPTTIAVGSLDMSGGVVAITSDTNPTTDAKGEIALDESDAGQEPLFVEAYDEGTGDTSRIVGTDIHAESFTIIEPDVAAAACADIKLKKFVAEAYPHGATIIAIHIETDGTDISDTFVFEQWNNADGGTQTLVESIALAATDTGEDDGIDAGSIAADWILVLNAASVNDDCKSVTITIVYRINPGD